MLKGITTVAALALVGCTAMPTDTPPPWQSRSTYYVLSGRQGWMPGRHLSFGPYRVDVDSSGHFNFLDNMLLNARHQSVALQLTDAQGGDARFLYQQRCDGHHGSVTFVEANKFAARIDVQGLQSTSSDPYHFTVGGHQYHLAYGPSNWPVVVSISQDGHAFAELHLGAYGGSMRAEDHIWLIKGLDKTDTLIGALLVSYAASYRPDYCDTDTDKT
ncbi:hypothetical protein [Gallaecimonas mangrovi]|uniref:hypothetical protein n=1 Tax=Gallaecimonas mangrovi TaxID=2291597 RepID=UPI000E1FCCE7|nr:hypothetical protein [Gallaecimonas mangrovi]